MQLLDAWIISGALQSGGADGQYLKRVGGVPAWADLPSFGYGSVTSVALALPSQFAISGSPVTGSGTLTGAWNNQTANTVLAGPTTGAAAAPAFRALVAGDIPLLPASQINGSGQEGALLVGNNTGSWNQLYPTGTYLKASGSTLLWGSIMAADIPSLDASKIGSGNLAIARMPSGLDAASLGDVAYGSGTNTWARLAGNTAATRKVLSQTGNGSVSAAPAWEWPLNIYYTNDVGNCWRLKVVDSTYISWGASAPVGSPGVIELSCILGSLPSHTHTVSQISDLPITGWSTPGGYSADRALSGGATLTEVNDVLCTLIADLKTKGILGA